MKNDKQKLNDLQQLKKSFPESTITELLSVLNDTEKAEVITLEKDNRVKTFEKDLFKKYLNKKVIVRTDRAGVFYGTFTAYDDYNHFLVVELEKSRRLWKWEVDDIHGKGISLSDLGIDGCEAKNSKFCIEEPFKILPSVIEIICCSEEAINSIESQPVYKAK